MSLRPLPGIIASEPKESSRPRKAPSAAGCDRIEALVARELKRTEPPHTKLTAPSIQRDRELVEMIPEPHVENKEWKPGEARTKTSLLDLPRDVFKHHITPACKKEDWVALKRTSQTLRDLTDDDEKWKELYLQHYGHLEKPAVCQTYEKAYNRLEINLREGRFMTVLHQGGGVAPPREFLAPELIKKMKFLPKHMISEFDARYSTAYEEYYAPVEIPLKEGHVWVHKFSLFVRYMNGDVIELQMDASDEQILNQIATMLDESTYNEETQSIMVIQQIEAWRRFGRMPESVQKEIFNRVGGMLSKLPPLIAHGCVNFEALAKGIRAYLSEKKS